MRIPCFVLAALLAAFSSVPIRADVVTLNAAKDTSLFQNNVNNSDGGGPAFFAGTNGMNSTRRALISFDFSSLPSGATITDVKLTLTLGQVSTSPPPNATISLFDVAQTWGQGTAGSTATSIGGTGQGFAANPGDATWNAALYSTTTPTAWTIAGGNHATSASASLFLDNNTINNSFTWLSTPQLVADAQSWLNNPATNFGWELINANESTSNSIYGFYSSEWDNAHFGGSATQVPALQVTFTVPEPATGVLSAIAALSLLAQARFRRRS